MGKTSKDKRDIYYRLAKEKGYRARSAFKLLQIDDEFGIFKGVQRVVDLCAAPGSWSQVLAERLRTVPKAKIVAVDLQPMAPIEGVVQIQGDITKPSTLQQILDLFEGEPADLVVCDGAPDVTGLHDLDEYMQSQLIQAAYSFARQILKQGGTFVAKIFRSSEILALYAQLGISFGNVFCFKPRSSRTSSMEHFVVCLGYNSTLAKADDNHEKKLKNDLDSQPIDVRLEDISLSDYSYVSFMTCGNMDELPDSDMTYPLGDDYVRLEPVQPPLPRVT